MIKKLIVEINKRWVVLTWRRSIEIQLGSWVEIIDGNAFKKTTDKRLESARR